MKDLEQTLENIKRLKRGLHAKIIISESTTIPKYKVGGCTCDGFNSYKTFVDIEEYDGEEYVPAVTTPDVKEQANARREMQEVHETCEWYSGRYESGKALKIPIQELNKEVDLWIDILKVRVLYSEKESFSVSDDNKTNAICDLKKMYKRLGLKEQRYNVSKLLNISEIDFLCDELSRNCCDLDGSELKELYCSNNVSSETRKAAGRKLNYWLPRIWLNEVLN